MTLEQQVHDLELRVKKLEKQAHQPVTFIEDENGFLRIAHKDKSEKGTQDDKKS